MNILEIIEEGILSIAPPNVEVEIKHESDINFIIYVDSKKIARCILSDIYLLDLKTKDEQDRSRDLDSLLYQLKNLTFKKCSSIQVIDLTPNGYPPVEYI
jgi:hypothetical protein